MNVDEKARRIARRERLAAGRPMPTRRRLDLLAALESQALDEDEQVIRARRAALLADLASFTETDSTP